MKKHLIALSLLFGCSAAPAPASVAVTWSNDQIDQLADWLDAAPKEAIHLPPASDFIAARSAGDPQKLQSSVTEAALKLANGYLHGNDAARIKAKWNVNVDADNAIDLRALLTASLAKNDVNVFFRSLRPHHPDYDVLRSAFATEADPARRAKLARNMERWRWMPQSLGNRYLLVNAAAYEVSLWEKGHKIQSWPVVVGKTKTPTPVFSTQVTGVNYNPWWNIPKSIVAESVGALTRRNPAEARRRGYVWSDSTFRQRPGRKNALGLMKLVMPNDYTIYLHDTPEQASFNKPARAFSHGCIRVSDALAFASTLLAGSTDQKQIDAVLASGKTATLSLAEPLPVYITYFTADAADPGVVRFHADTYGRDAAVSYIKI